MQTGTRKPEPAEARPDGHAGPPERVVLALRPFLADGSTPECEAMADVLDSGRFGELWVVLSGTRLFFIRCADSQTPEVRVRDLDKDSELEIVSGVGGSRFRLIARGTLAEELRFSARQAKAFSTLLHRAQKRIRGEPVYDRVGPTDEPADERLCRKCGQLIPDWADSCPRCLHKRKILWRLLSFAKPYKALLSVGLGSAVAGTLLQMAPPKLTQKLINIVLTPGPNQKPHLLWPLIAALAAVIGLNVFCHYLRLNRLARLSEFMTHDVRTAVFAHLQKLSLSYYSKKPTGNLISRITSDTDRLWDFIAFGVVDLFISVLVVIGVTAILFTEEPLLAALTVAPIPLSVALTLAHVRAMRRILGRLWARWSGMTSVLSDVIPGARVVKAFAQEDREARRFAGRSQAVVDDALRLHREWTTYWPRLTLLLNLGTIAIWAYGAPRVAGRQFDLGTFVMFLGYVWMFYGPIEHLGMMNRMFQRAATSAHRVFAVLDTPPTIYTRSSAAPRDRIDGRIVFDGVSFSYDGINRVLQNVSFEIDPGQIVGLAGPSGGGKTTLVNLICRFYDPVEGRILVDGIDLKDWDLHALRSRIGVVLQEPYLFQGTVAENIGYGNPGASMEQIIAAARAANAHDFIVGFPDGYDTLVGERGQTVSGGERQRLSIARAVLNNPRILILDEATSSVDSKTEMRIQEAIDRLVVGRTTLAIAHRLSTLRRADRLLILDKGKLVEQGNHQQLMEANGLYASLHKTQAELHALFAV